MQSTNNMSKKHLIEASDDELMELLDETSELTSVTIETNNDVYEFVHTFRLKKGDYQVTAKLIHKLYKQWSKSPLVQNTFTKELGLFIENTGQTGSVFFINLSEDELLKKTLDSFKKLDRTKNKPDKQHYDNFIKKYNIKPGTFFVKDSVLFNLYDKWIYEIKKSKPLSLFNFVRFCKLYFKNKMVDRHYWFSVDQSIIKYLSEDMISELIGIKREKEENKKR